MSTDPRLAELLAPLTAAKATRRRRALADPHTLRLVALFVVTAITIAAAGSYALPAGGILLGGAWVVGDRVRKATRLPLAVHPNWLGRAIDMNMTPTGRDQLTQLLLAGDLTPDDLIPWGRAELGRQRTEATEPAHFQLPPPAPRIPARRRR